LIEIDHFPQLRPARMRPLAIAKDANKRLQLHGASGTKNTSVGSGIGWLNTDPIDGAANGTGRLYVHAQTDESKTQTPLFAYRQSIAALAHGQYGGRVCR
jgi:hypothetical protein